MAVFFNSDEVWNTECTFLSRGKAEAENEWALSHVALKGLFKLKVKLEIVKVLKMKAKLKTRLTDTQKFTSREDLYRFLVYSNWFTYP